LRARSNHGEATSSPQLAEPGELRRKRPRRSGRSRVKRIGAVMLQPVSREHFIPTEDHPKTTWSMWPVFGHIDHEATPSISRRAGYGSAPRVTSTSGALGDLREGASCAIKCTRDAHH